MDEQDQTQNNQTPVEVEEVEVEKVPQPDRLSVTSFPFAAEFMAPNKERGLKILEEASEACEAFRQYLKGAPYSPEDQLVAQARFLDEFCDTFQALFTAAACVGVQQSQLDEAMQTCFEKNVDKGRYPDYSFGESEDSEDEPEGDPLTDPEAPASTATYDKPSLDEVMAHAMETWEL